MQTQENKSLTVELGERSYPILIGKNLEDSLLELKKSHLEEGRKVVELFNAIYRSNQARKPVAFPLNS